MTFRQNTELKPIVWSERPSSGGLLSVSVQLRFASVEKPRIGDNGNRILMPSQAQQLTRSYTGRLLVNVEITVREIAPPPLPTPSDASATPRSPDGGAADDLMEVDNQQPPGKDEEPVATQPPPPPVPRVHQADIRDLCIGDIPILVLLVVRAGFPYRTTRPPPGSVLCHQPVPPHCRSTAATNAAYFIVNGQSKVIVAQERYWAIVLTICCNTQM